MLQAIYDNCMDGIIVFTKTTAAQNEDALSYHRVRGLNFLAIVFVATIVLREYNVQERHT